MTDKELKKLSRLELLELLLTESRENERLREELEKIKQENTIKKSAQHLNEASENLGETSEKLQAALRQVSFIISSLDKTDGVAVEERTNLASDNVDENEQGDVIGEDIAASAETSPEVGGEYKKDLHESEDAEGVGYNSISKRLDRALNLVSSKIEELDRIVGIVESDKEIFSHYDTDEN